jgi:hypothetical protein
MAQVKMQELIKKDIENTRGASKRISKRVSSRLRRGEAARRVCRSLTPRSSSTVATGRDSGIKANVPLQGCEGQIRVLQRSRTSLAWMGDSGFTATAPVTQPSVRIRFILEAFGDRHIRCAGGVDEQERVDWGIGSWAEFSRLVRKEFGAEEYSQVMRPLLSLQQRGGVEEYIEEFEEARYTAAVHNLELDEAFLVAQFIKGLKEEIQGSVQVQFPQTVTQAVILARIQTEVMEKGRIRATPLFQPGRSGVNVFKGEGKVGGMTLPVFLRSDSR